MKPWNFILIATLALLHSTPTQASTKAAAKVKAAKGPVQITLHLRKTTVKMDKSLWYQLELKNVGKKKIRIEDQIFKDPYAMHVNSNSRRGLHIEIVDPSGKSLPVKWGNYRVKYDWEPPAGEDYRYTPEEKQEINTLASEWKKLGMTEQQKSLAESAWISKLRAKKNAAELADPANKHWLPPGASTTTFAWADRGPGEYPGRSEDDAALRDGYTELWCFPFLHPGKYRIRAVYNHARSGSNAEGIEKSKVAPEPWQIEFKTPFIQFEVLP